MSFMNAHKYQEMPRHSWPHHCGHISSGEGLVCQAAPDAPIHHMGYSEPLWGLIAGRGLDREGAPSQWSAIQLRALMTDAYNLGFKTGEATAKKVKK